MKLKRWIGLFLCFSLLFCLAACGSEEQDAPVSLEGKSEEEIIAQLLTGYKGLDLPSVSYNVSAKYNMAGEKVVSSAVVSVSGENCSVDSETEVDGISVPYSFAYVDGILYVNALGVRVKGAASSSDADAALQQQLPFELENTDLFATRTLLRSENGEYRVVLSNPKVDVTSLLNLSAAMKSEAQPSEEQTPAEGEEEASPEPEGDRLLRTGDFYVTLVFSSQGALIGMTMGGDVTVLSGGVEALLTFEVKYTDIKTDAVTVTAPADAEEYTEAEPETPTTENTEGSESSDTVE